MAGGSRDQRRAVPRGTAADREFIEADSVPDIYADEFWFGSGPLGGILTLIVMIPPAPGVATVPKGRIVARVRLPPRLVADLARVINEHAAATAITEQSEGGPKH